MVCHALSAQNRSVQSESLNVMCWRVAATRHAALCWQYAPPDAGAPALLREQPPSAVGDNEPKTGWPWHMGALVFGGQSALYGRASRDRVCPPVGLRGRLSRCEM